MDPNEAITEARLALNRYHMDEDGGEWEDIVTVLQSFEALDEWLSNGGFLPKAWQR